MNGLFGAAAEVQRVCEARGWRFCFIGGLAVLRWGEPRQTRDVDLTILTGFGDEEPYVDELLARFEGRIPDARQFALRNRVALLVTAGGIGIDAALGALPFEEHAVERSSLWDVGGGVSLRTCGPSDLIVHKAFAGRPQDWLDIEMIVARSGDQIDGQLVHAELEPLLELKGSIDALARVEALLRER